MKNILVKSLNQNNTQFQASFQNTTAEANTIAAAIGILVQKQQNELDINVKIEHYGQTKLSPPNYYNVKTIPSPGDIIYIPDNLNTDGHIGGRAIVNTIAESKHNNKTLDIKVEKFPHMMYTWNYLEKLQPSLKEQFKDNIAISYQDKKQQTQQQTFLNKFK